MAIATALAAARRRAQTTRFARTAAVRGWLSAARGAPMCATMMDGGCLYVEPDDAHYQSFLTLYAECVFDEGEWLYVAERPSSHLRFFVDLDMHVEAEADADALVGHVARHVAAHVASADGSERRHHCIVLRAPDKALADGTLKVGVHCVVPDTRVPVAHAEAWRDGLVARLERADPSSSPPPPLNGWDESVDASVYRNGGLRMVGSRKMVPCACAADDACTHRHRRVDEGRAYALDRVVASPHGERAPEWETRLARNPVLLVRMTSIRTRPPAEDTYEAPRPPRPRRPPHDPTGEAPTLARTVVGAVHAQHADAVVRPRGTGGAYALEGDGAHFCPNVARRHRQSTVYCTLTSRGLEMRCRCRKGSCPRFARTWPLSAEGARALGVTTSGQKRGLPHGFQI
jgi:hypothetical protein